MPQQPKFSGFVWESAKDPQNTFRAWPYMCVFGGIVANYNAGPQLERPLGLFLIRDPQAATTQPSFLQTRGCHYLTDIQMGSFEVLTSLCIHHDHLFQWVVVQKLRLRVWVSRPGSRVSKGNDRLHCCPIISDEVLVTMHLLTFTRVYTLGSDVSTFCNSACLRGSAHCGSCAGFTMMLSKSSSDDDLSQESTPLVIDPYQDVDMGILDYFGGSSPSTRCIAARGLAPPPRRECQHDWQRTRHKPQVTPRVLHVTCF